MPTERTVWAKYKAMPPGATFRLWGFDSYGGEWKGESVTKEDGGIEIRREWRDAARLRDTQDLRIMRILKEGD